MAEIKTKATEVSVDDFIEAVPVPQRREDAKKLRAMLERVTGEPAKMWGPTIIGFGSYHYKYESGHEGVMCRMGFSPRKAELVLYVLTEHRRGAGAGPARAARQAQDRQVLPLHQEAGGRGRGACSRRWRRIRSPT